MGTVENGGEQKARYPKSVFFIITMEFCERFSYYGLRAILVLYLNYELKYSKEDSTIIYHTFAMLCYFFPLFGAIIADNWLGKYQTILYLSVIHAIGNILVSIAAVSVLDLPHSELTLLGLVLLAIGTGGMKPCIVAFGGEQFEVPEQEKALQKYFSIFYFSVHLGSLSSTFIAPILREDLHCLGQDSCFPLAFGAPAALMVVSLVSFVAGTTFYKRKAPEGNIILKISKCILHALQNSKSSEKKAHWLDKADDKFDQKFIEEVKILLKVLLLIVPIPLFSALFDQQGSRWTFQAAHMNGDIAGGWSMKPDQMHFVNSVLCLIFIPIFDHIIYPLLARFNLLKKPLKKIVIGGVLTAASFIAAAFVEFQLETTYPALPTAGEGQLRLYNNVGCDLQISMENFEPIFLKNLEMWGDKNIPLKGQEKSFEASWQCVVNYGLNSKEEKPMRIPEVGTGKITIFNAEATSYTFYNTEDQPFKSRKENVDKSNDGNPTVMISYKNENSTNPWNEEVSFETNKGEVKLKVQLNSTEFVKSFQKIPKSKSYDIKISNQTIENVELHQGGSYVIMVQQDKNGTFTINKITINEPNSISMMWLLPQYIILTAGELMFAIPAIEFIFNEAPPSMKSLMAAVWQLTTAFGNVIVIIIAKIKFFDSLAYEFLLFAALMLADMLLFDFLAMRYTYTNESNDQEDEIAIAKKNVAVELKEDVYKRREED